MIACMLNFDLVSILFSTSIPTSFNILVEMFLHFDIYDYTQLKYIVWSSEFTQPQRWITIYVSRQGIIACNNNNMRNPSLHFISLVSEHGSVFMLTEVQSESETTSTLLNNPWHCPMYHSHRTKRVSSTRVWTSAQQLQEWVFFS